MEALFIQAKQAGKCIAGLSDDFRNDVLRAVADELVSSKEELLRANAEDLARMDPASPLYDRLMLTDARIDAIAADMRNVASLPSPLGRVLLDRVLPNGLQLRKVAVPFGVIGVIYEARPNVTLDVFSLCFKSGNACVLKGGKDADASNRAAVAVVQRVLAARGVAPAAATLLPATHAAEEGIRVLIANGKRECIVRDLYFSVPGTVCTEFVPVAGAVSSVKKWIAHSSGFAKGTVTVNAAAREALCGEQAVSLLPVGVVAVEGDFEEGDIIGILDPSGAQFAVGRSAYSAAQAREVIGQHDCRPLVHYDYLSLL